MKLQHSNSQRNALKHECTPFLVNYRGNEYFCAKIYILHGLDKKLWQKFFFSEMTLLIEVQTFTHLQYNHPHYLSPFAKCLEGVLHHLRVHFC